LKNNNTFKQHSSSTGIKSVYFGSALNAKLDKYLN